MITTALLPFAGAIVSYEISHHATPRSPRGWANAQLVPLISRDSVGLALVGTL